LQSRDAQRWCGELKAAGCVTDVRGDVLRIGLGLYHDASDVDAFVALARSLT
jgi:selenocysteine lyase/cysteine desulfurase